MLGDDLVGAGVQSLHRLGEDTGERADDSGAPGGLFHVTQRGHQFVGEPILDCHQGLGALDVPLVLTADGVVQADGGLQLGQRRDRALGGPPPPGQLLDAGSDRGERLPKLRGLDVHGEGRRRSGEDVQLAVLHEAFGVFHEQRAQCGLVDPACVVLHREPRVQADHACGVEGAQVPAAAVCRLDRADAQHRPAHDALRPGARFGEGCDQGLERCVGHTPRVVNLPGGLLSWRMASVGPIPEPGRPSAWDLAARIRPILARIPVDPPTGDEPRAAVLILLYDRDGVPHLVLTKRTDTLVHHPGQISLPGGRWETEDGDLGTTALRETHEELGVSPDAVRLVGRLADERTMVSGFVVAPYVGVSVEALHPVPCEREIARVLEVPLDALLAADAALPEALDVVTLRYPLQDEDVWGATARILHDFSGVVRAALIGLDATGRGDRE